MARRRHFHSAGEGSTVRAIVLMSLIVVLLAATGCAEPANQTSQPPTQPTQPPPSAPAPTASSASPASPATPQSVTESTYVVNSVPVGCHEAPTGTAAVVVLHEIGVVQAMDQFLEGSEEAWHREADSRCWVRTNPGPVTVYRNRDDAERYAASLRPTPTPAPTASPSPFAAGQWVAVNGPGVGDCSNVRAQPSLTAAIVTCLKNGTTVQLIGESTRADAYTWWRHTGGGWTVDANFLPAAAPSPTATAGRECTDAAAAARLRPSVVRLQGASGMGTGFVVGAEGIILTANHVVEFDRAVAVTLASGQVVAGQVQGRRPEQDLAVVRISAGGLTAVAWGDDRALRPGQRLLSLGYARDLPGEPSLTGGAFSARRSGSFVRLGADLIQTDTPLNSGNSGGPLFSDCGEVVGVVTGVLRDAQGLGFAIAASHARPTAEALSRSSPAVAPSPVLTPAETVTVFYSLLDQRQYGLAYAMFSTRRKAEGTLAEFQAGFATTRNVYLEEVTVAPGTPAVVQVSILAADLVSGQVVVRRFAGTWTFVQEGNRWTLDRGQIRQVP